MTHDTWFQIYILLVACFEVLTGQGSYIFDQRMVFCWDTTSVTEHPPQKTQTNSEERKGHSPSWPENSDKSPIHAILLFEIRAECMKQVTYVNFTYGAMTCTYLTSEHGTEIITAGSQHNPVGREVFLLYSQGHITEGVALPEGVHGVEDGLGMSICHYVFGGHNAAHQALWRKNKVILG